MCINNVPLKCKARICEITIVRYFSFRGILPAEVPTFYCFPMRYPERRGRIGDCVGNVNAHDILPELFTQHV